MKKTLHYLQGYKAAKDGAFRASPNLKICTSAWRDWYKGFDDATSEGNNSKLDSNFSLRNKSEAFRVSF